jgi:hypothetical protein
MIYKTNSKWFTLLMNLKLEHVINPWVFIIDLNKEIITIEKRNWYFLGKNSNTIAFKFIRVIDINEHVFGADIYVKAIGGWVSAKYLPKRDLKNIRKILIEYNQTKNRHIIFS